MKKGRAFEKISVQENNFLRRERISAVLAEFSEKYVEEAAEEKFESKLSKLPLLARQARHERGKHENEPVRTKAWKSFGIAAGAAACCAVVLFAVLCRHTPELPKNGETNVAGELVSVGGVMRCYKTSVRSSEKSIAMQYPWEELEIYEQYCNAVYNGRMYQLAYPAALFDKTLSAELLGEACGECTAISYEGQDAENGRKHERTFTVYRVKEISEKFIIAVFMEEKYYIFQCGEYEPPENLGEFIDSYQLPETVRLQYFEKESGEEKESYLLADDAPLWELLSACRAAEFVGEERFAPNGGYLAFSVTSEALGTYKQVLYITEDGYLKTNCANWAYCFFIGEETAGKIIKYATEHAVKTEPEPYCYYLGGTIAELNEDYILVDDSVLCVDEKNGMIFKVPLNRLELKRCIKYSNLKKGDLVCVSFFGQIDRDRENTACDVWEIHSAAFYEGGWLVKE